MIDMGIVELGVLVLVIVGILVFWDYLRKS